MLLPLRFIVFTTAPVFDTPVNPDEAPDALLPRTTFELIFNAPGKELFKIPIKVAPAVEQFRMLLLLMLIVAPESAVVMP